MEVSLRSSQRPPFIFISDGFISVLPYQDFNLSTLSLIADNRSSHPKPWDSFGLEHHQPSHELKLPKEDLIATFEDESNWKRFNYRVWIKIISFFSEFAVRDERRVLRFCKFISKIKVIWFETWLFTAWYIFDSQLSSPSSIGKTQVGRAKCFNCFIFIAIALFPACPRTFPLHHVPVERRSEKETQKEGNKILRDLISFLTAPFFNDRVVLRRKRRLMHFDMVSCAFFVCWPSENWKVQLSHQSVKKFATGNPLNRFFFRELFMTMTTETKMLCNYQLLRWKDVAMTITIISSGNCIISNEKGGLGKRMFLFN